MQKTQDTYGSFANSTNELEAAKMLKGICSYLLGPAVHVLKSKGVTEALKIFAQAFDADPFIMHKLVPVPLDRDHSFGTAGTCARIAFDFLSKQAV